MKNTFLKILIFLLCSSLVSCVIETPSQHYDTIKDGEPTGKFAVMSVECGLILDYPDKISEQLSEFIPSEGVIIEEESFEIMKNDTALKFLTDVLKDKEILYSASKTYVSSINHVGERDFGAESGWVFIVNGKFSSVGAASYYVKEDDVIEWRYSVVRGDLGLNEEL